MLVTAQQKNSRQTARKVREVVDVIRDLSIKEALNQLAVMDRKASIVVLKVLRQAIANAINNFGLQVGDLTINEILVNEGQTYKRWRPVSRGRAHKILKRSCHVKITLESKEFNPKAVAKAKKQAKNKSKVKKIAFDDKKEIKKENLKKDSKAIKPGKKSKKVVKSTVANQPKRIKLKGITNKGK